MANPEQEQVAEFIATQLAEVRPGATRCEPDLTFTDAEGMGRYVLAELDKLPEGYLELGARMETGLGILAPGTDLGTALVEMYSANVAGFFDPVTNQMLLQEQIHDDELLAVLRHELVHCQQHATWDLVPLADVELGNNDAAQGRHLLIEGDAELTRMALDADPAQVPDEYWAEVLHGWLGMSSPRTDHRIWLRESVLGYSIGTAVLAKLYSEKGWSAVDAWYLDPPVSTEQLLHYDKLVARELPVVIQVVEARAGEIKPGVSPSFSDTLGEGRLIAMFMEGHPLNKALACAAGWGGDRLFVLDQGEEIPTVVGQIAWDSVSDAKQGERCLRDFFDRHLHDNATVQRKRDRLVFVTANPRDSALMARAWKAFE